MALLVAFAVVFLAEFGEKTEVLTLAFAAQYGPWPVLVGVSKTAALNVLAVTLGTALAHAIPPHVVTLLAGVAFLLFALWSGGSDRDAPVGGGSKPRVAARSAGLFAVSEIGDKTMLATIALAAHADAVPVWAGSTVGVVAAETIAVLVGAQAGSRLSYRAVRTGSAILFVVIGAGLIAAAAG